MSDFYKYENLPNYEGEDLKYKIRNIKRDTNAGISFEVFSFSNKGEVSFRIQDFNIFSVDSLDDSQITFLSNMSPEQNKLISKTLLDGLICETYLVYNGETKRVFLPNFNHPSLEEARDMLRNHRSNEIQGKSYYNPSESEKLNFNIVTDPSKFIKRNSNYFDFKERRFASLDPVTHEEIALEFTLSDGSTFQIRGSEVSLILSSNRIKSYSFDQATEKDKIIQQALKDGLLSKVFIKAKEGENKYKFLYVVNPFNASQYNLSYDPDYYDEYEGIDNPIEGLAEQQRRKEEDSFIEEQRRRRQQFLEEQERAMAERLREQQEQQELENGIDGDVDDENDDDVEQDGKKGKKGKKSGDVDPVDDDDIDGFSEYGGF